MGGMAGIASSGVASSAVASSDAKRSARMEAQTIAHVHSKRSTTHNTSDTMGGEDDERIGWQKRRGDKNQ